MATVRSPESESPADRWGALAAAALALVLFLNILPNTFIWDDWQQIFENPYLRSSAGIGKILASNVWGFEGKNTNYYRPLMHLTFFAGLHWFGSNPAGYHAISILLHAATSALAFLLLRRWSRNSGIALGAALLFAAHPIHTENVCWISGYPDLEATLFVLFALLLHAQFIQALSAEASASPRVLWRAHGVGLLFFLALLSKETAIVLPPICLAWELLQRRGIRRIVQESWPVYASMTAAFLAYMAMRINALGGIMPYSKVSELPPGTETYTKIALVYRYVEILFWPGELTVFHKFPPSTTLFAWRVILGALLLGLLAWGFLRLWRERCPEAIGLLIFAAALAPAFALPYGDFNLLGERYLYLPSLGFCWLIAWSVSKLAGRLGHRGYTVLFAGLLAACAVRTEARNLDWLSEIPFYQKCVTLAPALAELRVLLGEAYLRRDMLPQALQETRLAASLKKDYPEAANNLGQIYSRLDQPVKAVEQYSLAIGYAENIGMRFAVARAYNNLAFERSRMGDPAKAILAYRKAIEIQPGFAGAYNNLGYLFLEEGDYVESESNLKKALEIEPTFAKAASNLGLLYIRMNKLDAADAALSDALRLEPRSGETYARIGELLLARGDRERAIQFFRRALELHPDNPRATAALGKLQAPR